jgi:NhaA family Na+:H+ antiporter
MKKTVNLLQEFSIHLSRSRDRPNMGQFIAGKLSSFRTRRNSRKGFDSLFGKRHFYVFFFAMATWKYTELVAGGRSVPIEAVRQSDHGHFRGSVGTCCGIFYFKSLHRQSGVYERMGIQPLPTSHWLARRPDGFRFASSSGFFLLLLAIADDGIGLLIIAFFYTDPSNPLAPQWLLLTLAGMLVAFILNKRKVRSYWPYLIAGGTLSWIGLFMTGVHSSLALVFIVPFFPHAGQERLHLFEDDACDFSTLKRFQNEWKIIVDFGLLLFGLTMRVWNSPESVQLPGSYSQPC